MATLLRVDGHSSVVCNQTDMVEQHLEEVKDLETWIVDHPEALDPKLKIITTQFNRWASKEDSALERPDIIALSEAGELVVIELKRVKDTTVHLQALTYAALASSFTLDLLAEEHASWHNNRSHPDEKITTTQAKEELESFIEADEKFDEELGFALPRIMLVAPEFPGQVLTTLQWLGEIAPDLTIECHQYRLFTVPVDETSSHLVASFTRIFPVTDIQDFRLRAQSPRVTAAKEQQKSRQRRAVARILENRMIPDNASLTFNPAGQGKKESVPLVQAWLEEDPVRQDVTWDAHSSDPLRWGVEPEKRWSATRLRNEFFRRAGAPPATARATEGWHYQGEHLSEIADRTPAHPG